jgi:hypothetical protein
MEQPDRAGIDESNHWYMRLAVLRTIGFVETHLGFPSALRRADAIENDPLFEVNAWRMRMFFALQQGDHKRFEYCRKQVELLRIQNSPTQVLEGGFALGELIIYAASDDLVSVKQLLPSIEAMTKRHPNWIPIVRG